MTVSTNEKCPFHSSEETLRDQREINAISEVICDTFDIIREKEVSKFGKKLNMNETEIEKIEEITKAFIKQVANLPIQQLAQKEGADKYDAIKQLADLFHFDCPYFE
ncbi:hypothetical protein V6R21_13445 [Limibacter armeniacum]|uniref:hypothetical protein n=1 Tax=Limibacter armeniacum TaxID=466084 RepID=UPI002FE53966